MMHYGTICRAQMDSVLSQDFKNTFNKPENLNFKKK